MSKIQPNPTTGCFPTSTKKISIMNHPCNSSGKCNVSIPSTTSPWDEGILILILILWLTLVGFAAIACGILFWFGRQRRREVQHQHPTSTNEVCVHLLA